MLQLKMNNLNFIKNAVIENGLAWVVKRSLYELKKKTNIYKLKFKPADWRENEITKWVNEDLIKDKDLFFQEWKKNKPNFFINGDNIEIFSKSICKLIPPDEKIAIINKAENIKKGIFSYFSSNEYNIGFPPDWHFNPKNQFKIKKDVHFSNIPIYSKSTGDIKYFWEIGRFSFTYDLIRAYYLTKDSSYPEAFWNILEHWYDHNPINTGVHWKCGQEIALRIMAIFF